MADTDVWVKATPPPQQPALVWLPDPPVTAAPPQPWWGILLTTPAP